MRHVMRMLALAVAVQLTGAAPAFADGPPVEAAPGNSADTQAVPAPLPTPATPPLPSFGASLKGLPRDVWRFVSLDTAVVAGIGLGAAGVGHLRDDEVLEELQENVRFEDFVRPGNLFGSFAVQAGGALAVYVGARAAGHPRLAGVAMDVLRANVVSQAWTQAVKVAVHRDRPDGTRFSFPSGHSASAFATATVVHHAYGWKLGVPAYTLATYVATARIAQNHHYLSDVVFGAALGVAGGQTITIGRGAHRVQVSPTLADGGVGLQCAVVSGR